MIDEDSLFEMDFSSYVRNRFFPLPFLHQDFQTPTPLIESAALSATAYTVLIGLA